MGIRCAVLGIAVGALVCAAPGSVRAQEGAEGAAALAAPRARAEDDARAQLRLSIRELGAEIGDRLEGPRAALIASLTVVGGAVVVPLLTSLVAAFPCAWGADGACAWGGTVLEWLSPWGALVGAVGAVSALVSGIAFGVARRDVRAQREAVRALRLQLHDLDLAEDERRGRARRSRSPTVVPFVPWSTPAPAAPTVIYTVPPVGVGVHGTFE